MLTELETRMIDGRRSQAYETASRLLCDIAECNMYLIRNTKDSRRYVKETDFRRSDREIKADEAHDQALKALELLGLFNVENRGVSA